MSRIEWGVIVVLTWVMAESIWWLVIGQLGASFDEAMTVTAGAVIAILTCPNSTPQG